MTDPRKQAWLPYLRLLADEMRLKDWKFQISDHPSDKGSGAEINMATGHHAAFVYLSEYFLDEEPAEQRVILVHELIHAKLHHVHSVADRELRGAALRAFDQEAEFAIQELALLIAPHMPLPVDSDDEGDENKPMGSQAPA